jgi:hypothetical protein
MKQIISQTDYQRQKQERAMSGKTYLIMAALVTLLSTGCTRQIYHDGGSPIDKNWGRSYEEQKYSQIIDHEAGKNLDPVVGLDGKAAVNTVESYQESFKGKQNNEVVNILKLQ